MIDSIVDAIRDEDVPPRRGIQLMIDVLQHIEPSKYKRVE